MSVYGERVAGLEARVGELERTMARVESKLDDLLTLKNKGAGAFWLVSILVGTGLISALTEAAKWFFSR